MQRLNINFIKFSAIIATLIVVFLISSFSNFSQAATGINRQINFQGKLVTNPQGTNVSDTSYTVVFTFYDKDTGGTALWTETQTVTTVDGIFRVALGSVTPIPANFNFNWSGLYLGIKVNSDSEMTPRIQMAAVPFAFNSEKVSGLTVQDTSGNASTSGTLQIANAKTINLGTQNLTFTTSADTTLTLPTTGTLATLAGSEILTNKTIGSGGLVFNNSSKPDITTISNQNFIITPNGSGLIGLNTNSPLATFDLRINGVAGGTIPIASLSGATSFAGLVIDQTGVGSIFTASASGLPVFTITKSGGLALGPTQTVGLSTQCLTGGNNPSWGTCGSGSSGPFQELSGAIVPNNSTEDLLIGGQSSTSALFRVTGSSAFAGTKSVASISANTSFAGLVVDNKGVGDIFTASKAGQSLFTIKNNGVIVAPNYATCNLSTDSVGQVGCSSSNATTFIGARIYNSTNQTVSASTETTLVFDSEEYDTDGFHDTSLNNSRITVPQGMGGKYMVVAIFGASSSPNASYGRIRKNGSDVDGGTFQWETGSGNFLMSHTMVLDLVPGDYIELRGFRTSGTTFNGGAGNSQRSELSLVKMDAGRVGLGVGAKVYRTTTQNPGGSYTAIGMNAEVFDSDNFHDNSTNNTRLTIPPGMSGRYIAVVATGSHPTNGFLAIRENGTNFLTFYGFGTSNSAGSATTIVNLNAGDYLEAMSSGNGNVTIDSDSGFSIMRLDASTSSSPLVESGGVIFENNLTSDFLLGSQTTASAKFAFINNALSRGSQVASISGSLVLDSSSASIQNTNNQLLTLGGNSTGDIQFKPGNSSLSLYLTSNGRMGLGTTSPLTTLDIRGNSGTLAVASFSANTSFSGLIIDQTGTGDIFTASASGQPLFTITKSGAIQLGTSKSIGLSSQCLTGGNNPSWGTCGSGSSGPFQELSGAIVPNNSTEDLLIGGQSSTSALFRVTGSSAFAGTTSVASISANTSFAGLVVDNKGVGDIFTASKAGTSLFTIKNSGILNAPNYASCDLKTDAFGNFICGLDATSGGSGGALVGLTAYDPAISGSYTTTTTFADMDATNLAVTFTAPSSGTVLIRLTVQAFPTSAASSTLIWGFREGSNQVGERRYIYNTGTNTVTFTASATFTISGLTPGSVHTYKWAAKHQGASWTARWGGGDDNFGPATMEVWDAGTSGGSSSGFSEIASNGTIIQNNQTEDLLLGGTASTSAKFHIYGTALGGTSPVASIAGNTSFAGLVIDQTGVGSIFTASASGLPVFTITKSGGLALGPTQTVGLSTQCLTGGNNPSWGTCGSGSSGPFQELSGAIVPNNSTEDLLIGGQSSTSALFRVTGSSAFAGTTSVASIAAHTSFAGLVIDQTGAGDLITASASGLSLFTVSKNGSLTLSGNTSSFRFTGTGISQITTAANQNLAINPGTGGLVGLNTGSQSVLATFDVRSNSGTIPIASLSGATSFAGLVIDNSGVGDIFTASASGATRFLISQSGLVTIGSTTNGLTFDPVNGGPTYNGNGRPTKTITLSPEYAGSTLTASGSATTTGSMTADASPSASFRTYYEWSSTQTSLQDYTVAVRVTLPSDFSDWASGNTLTISYENASNVSSTNKLDAYIYKTSDSSGNPVYFSTGNVSTAKTWTTLNLTKAQLSDSVSPDWNTAGQTAIIYLKMYASGTYNYTHIGDIVLNYLAKF